MQHWHCIAIDGLCCRNYTIGQQVQTLNQLNHGFDCGAYGYNDRLVEWSGVVSGKIGILRTRSELVPRPRAPPALAAAPSQRRRRRHSNIHSHHTPTDALTIPATLDISTALLLPPLLPPPPPPPHQQTPAAHHHGHRVQSA